MIPVLPAVCWLHIDAVSVAEIALADNLPAAVRDGLGHRVTLRMPPMATVVGVLPVGVAPDSANGPASHHIRESLSAG